VARTVLIVDADPATRDALVGLFEMGGNDAVAVGTVEDATAALHVRSFDLIIADLRVGCTRDGGLLVLAAAGLLSPYSAIIVFAADPSSDDREASHRLGATHVLPKPVDLLAVAALAAERGVSSALYPAGLA
jgi:DNA-binding NtrC family response regulator